MKKYDLAISDYSVALKLSPNNPEPYAYRGRAYYEIDNSAKSLNDLNKAIELDKKFVYAYYNRALLKYTKLKQYSSACEDLKIASELGDIDSKEFLNEYCK